MWRLRATDPSPQNDNRLGQHRGDDRGTIPSCHGCEHLRYYSRQERCSMAPSRPMRRVPRMKLLRRTQ